MQVYHSNQNQPLSLGTADPLADLLSSREQRTGWIKLKGLETAQPLDLRTAQPLSQPDAEHSGITESITDS